MDPCEGSNKSDKMDAESSPSSKADALSTGKNKKIIKLMPSIEIAKKRVRAFSIQKKTPITPMVVSKTITSSNTTPVIIGKLTGVKVTPKVEPDPEQKKLKPPKPGASRRSFQDSYVELQKRTLSEIEDMKRKMELVELGIPLGLICPTSTSEKAMPTKAMPPIKSFLDQSKVDELIREAKKAKQEGREYKFDYHKLLPDYDNPFQKRKEEPQLSLPNTYEKERKSDRRRSEIDRERDREKERRRYDIKRNDYKKDSKYKERDKERRHEEAVRDTSDEKETDVNLNDYLVCDSWSLENDDKNSTTSPKVTEKPMNPLPTIPIPPVIEQKIPLPPDPLAISTKNESLKASAIDSEKTVPIKIDKLQPVIDSFKYEIDPNDDEVLDIFDEDSELDRYAQQTKAKHRAYYDSPDKSMDYDQDNTKDTSMDGLNDDTFLESVINEIKQETLSDDGIHDKGLVEYEMSPNKEESPVVKKRSSVTPEIDDKIINQSKRRSYSEGYRSSDSYKSVDTIESGYKSMDSFRLSLEKELDGALEANMSKSTVDSLETWSFVLKICQPLLFRHDKNKCYKETRTNPKLWFVENPKACDCVKDRGVVYEELEMCKMALVDRVYGCDQIPDAPFPMTRKWYPRNSLCPTENTPVPLSNEWEAEDSQMADRGSMGSTCTTPQRNDEMSLDREYQRFMEAVWPDVADTKKETSRSTTPVRHESRKKKKEDADKDAEEKKPKKIKLSSEGWSQESDIEEEDKRHVIGSSRLELPLYVQNRVAKRISVEASYLWRQTNLSFEELVTCENAISKKQKMEKEKTKSRKRKRSSSTMSSSVSENEEEARKKRKLLKKKVSKTYDARTQKEK
ncbi:jg16977 [Pararge aegeria aegeria]|uniref:Jg16977 protein n=1 Tax=Pararge aegeria aegeria TaxID=348720 RepID=A0A8S4RGF4_9NEOP|nr:jg16977 [Pararge aegeria aegeria]